MSNFIMTTVIATVASSAMKGAEAPAQFIDDVMEVVGFGKFTEYASKKKALRELNVEDYK